MKRWLALMCALWCLAANCFAEDILWSAEEWEAVAAAMASDVPDPVPEWRRMRVNARALRTAQEDAQEAGWANLLLLSTDAEDIDRNSGRSDALMVCRVNLDSGNAYLLSLPEDAMVVLPGLPEPVALRYVNCFGGPALTAKTVNQALGLRINRYCAVNIEAFTSIVDVMGGVTLDLTVGEAEALGLSAGRQLLNGEESLRYVKLRQSGDGAQRGRALLEAVLRQALSGESLGQALNLADMMLPRLDTNLLTDDVVDLAFALFGQETPGTMLTMGLDSGRELTGGAEASRAFLYTEGE